MDNVEFGRNVDAYTADAFGLRAIAPFSYPPSSGLKPQFHATKRLLRGTDTIERQIL
jgi:hypothetical protein